MCASTSKAAAFFDLDRTLIKENSATLYIKHEYKQGRISLSKMMVAGVYLGLYHFSLMNIEKAYRRATTSMKGADPTQVQERTHTWFQDTIAHLLLPGAKESLAFHREHHHPCVLLTGSTEFMAREAVDAWALDDWLANCFMQDEDGKLTGEVSSPLCYADGKVHWAEQWAKEHGISLEESYFYTDSYSDLTMLERVGHPRVINPDPKLRALAQRRNWPILDWTQDNTTSPTS